MKDILFMDKGLFPREWVVIFVLISSIFAVLIVGGVKRQVIKNRLIYIKEKDFVVEKSTLLLFFPPMNHSAAIVK